MRVSIYDRKTSRGTPEFFLAAFVDEKIIALKHVDFSSTPDLSAEEVAEELERSVRTFKDEISQVLVGEQPDEAAPMEPKTRKYLNQ